MTTKLTPTNGIGVPSTVITDTQDVLEKVMKGDKFGDIWWEAPKSKTHTEEDILEVLELDKPIGEEVLADIACGWVAKNF